jgi:hypothetical protein
VNPRSDLRTFLRSLDRASLVELLFEQADRDPDQRRRLESRAEGDTDGDLAAVSDLLDDAARDTEAVQLASVLDTLRRLLDGGTPADVAPLARRAVDTIIGASATADRSGHGSHHRLSEAVSLYARACSAHPPDPWQLARWFTGVAFGSPGWPEISLGEFATALGERGIEHVRTTVDSTVTEELARGDAGFPERLRTARRLSLDIAETTGDVDTVVRLLSEQLPRLDVSMRIVRVLRAAGRHTEAIAHAAQALGGENGCRGASAVPPGHPRPVRGAERVDRLLGENRVDEAWAAAARCPPTDVIAVYRRHVERLLQRRDPARYECVAGHLRRLRTLHRRAGSSAEFTGYLRELVTAHKRKTRLLAEIRKARIALPAPMRQP